MPAVRLFLGLVVVRFGAERVDVEGGGGCGEPQGGTNKVSEPDGLAAQNLGLECVGVELEEDSCRIAAARAGAEHQKSLI